MTAERDGEPSAGTLLSVHGLAYRYTSRSTPLLQDVSFNCPAGTLTVIEGQNGSGKSTLLELCAGLRKPMHGTVERHARISYLPQASTSLLLNLTGVEHARLFGAACGMSGADAVAALKSLLERLDFINADIGSALARLSGGSRQKLSLALSLLDERARLYLLDEPYAGFDAASLVAMMDLFNELLAAGKALVMVNHLTDLRLRIDQTVTVAVASVTLARCCWWAGCRCSRKCAAA